MGKRVPDWWRERRFGVSFHWGIYSMLGRGEWVRHMERIPMKEYEKLALNFKPAKGWADNWARFVKESGAGYAVMTTKHHDGYCLFDTETTDYFSAPKSGPGSDLVAEYVRACRENDIKVGFYYSAPDWRFFWDKEKGFEIEPDDSDLYREYKEVTLKHIEELCRNYGQVDYWFWDGYPPEVEKTVTRMKQWQPEMLINDRCGLKLGLGSGEKRFYTPPFYGYDWELTHVSNDHWGYFASDDCWLSLKKSIHWITCTASMNGNFLFNVGPMTDGKIPERATELFGGIGTWLQEHGESYYGTASSNIEGGCSGCTTAKGDTCYLHIHHYVYPYYVVISPEVDIISATVMKTGQKLDVKKDGIRFIITGLPEKAPDANNTVIVLKTDGPAEMEEEEPPEEMKGFVRHEQDALFGQ